MPRSRSKEGAAPSDDYGWRWGEVVEGSRNNVKCKFCERIITKGITRLKEHLAGKIGNVKGAELLRAGITRFATNFITLESIVRSKQALKEMVTSSEWKRSTYARRPAGQDMMKVTDSNQFWKKVDELLLYRDKVDSFGTPLAQAAILKTNPEEDSLSAWIEEKEDHVLDSEHDVSWLPEELLNETNEETRSEDDISHEESVQLSTSSSCVGGGGDDDDDNDDEVFRYSSVAGPGLFETSKRDGGDRTYRRMGERFHDSFAGSSPYNFSANDYEISESSECSHSYQPTAYYPHYL
ncbi:hypothetical protein V6N11_039416 [Hibiscus sabdariffa]|uniref:BED-type domain-containing protein n=1 Tax=Hibiscus sabdariffa TaxID=183260 RepID=A0ABR2SMU5_9ROSI